MSAKFGRDDKFKNQVLSHEHYLQSTGVFDDDKILEYYHAFPNLILRNQKIWKEHLQFLKEGHISQRGGGFWFWKPTLIYHHLQYTLQNEGDFLVYSDNDLIEHVQILPFLLEDMVRKHHNLALHEMDAKRPERTWTKRDLYEAYCPANRSLVEDTSPQFDAMFIVLRKDAATLQFTYQYAEAVKNYHALGDDPSWIPNFSMNFSTHTVAINPFSTCYSSVAIKHRIDKTIPMRANGGRFVPIGYLSGKRKR